MRIILCLDYSSYTGQVLDAVKLFYSVIKAPELTVLHITDEQLFYATTGYEVQLGETVHRESMELKRLCTEYFGDNTAFREEYGIPTLKVSEILAATDYDVLIAGSNSRHGLGSRGLGSFAAHLLRISRKPVMIIPLTSIA